MALYTARLARGGNGRSQLIMSLVVIVVIVVLTAAGATLVVLLDDRSADPLDLLLLLLRLLRVRLRVGRQPVLPVLDRVEDSLLLVLVHLVAHAGVVARPLNRRLHRVQVVVERVA